MNVVYAVVHRRPWGRDDLSLSETKFIGFVATIAEAVEAIARLEQDDGFKDHPSGFAIHRIAVDVEDAGTGLGIDG